MILGAEASDIIAYLKTVPGKFASLPEISRRAGDRRRFEESPDWARNLMSPLLNAGLIEVNENGLYRLSTGAQPEPSAPARLACRAPRKSRAKLVGDDYFPTSDESDEGPRIRGGDYFPETE